MATKKKMLQAAAGSATGGAGGAGLDITDVFSTYLYEGTGSAQTINNGIDLDGEGGLVWVKNRDTTDWHHLCDTERGSGKILFSNSTNGQVTNNNTISGFSASGFSLSGDGAVNTNGENYASWTFRKAPKFFDVVTWTGDGVAGRTVSHNLGSAPGMIIVKKLDGTAKSWAVYHQDIGNGYQLYLDTTSTSVGSSAWNYTDPTDSVFTLGNNALTNTSGNTYVAYLFAHNNGDGEFGPDGDQDIIKCGSYTGNNSTNGPEIDLGFEPQWIMIKNATASQSWWMHDTMRGIVTNSNASDDARLKANATTAEDTNNHLHVTPTGFKLTSSASSVNDSNTFIYIAIRRGPLAPPESATEVFEPTAYTGNGTADRTIGNLTVDMNIVMDRTNTSTGLSGYHTLFDRVRGEDNVLKLTRTDSEGNGWGNTYYNLDQQYGFSNGSNTSYFNNSDSSYISYIWKRAPNFCDVVAYTGTGSAGHTVSHNLGVAPEMIWVKQRDTTRNWGVYHKLYGGTHWARLNQTSGFTDDPSFWNDTDSTSSVFTLGNDTETNQSSGDYIAYLFASLPGISKVGSYTGNNGTQTIDCGFTSGARFILIKRSSGNGDWFVWDTTRGINAGSDPYLKLNATDAESPGQDEIDAHASGFIINSPGGSGDAEINKSGSTYIFYAIA